jgi:flagellar motor switch protein FliM
MTIQLHDFSRPPSLHPETRSNLVQWLTRSNAMLAEVIAGFSLKVEVSLDDCTTAWPTTSLPEWPERAVSYRVKLADLTALSVIVLPNPLAQVMIASMLGNQLREWPQERDLTAGERSVGEFVITKIVDCLVDGWLSDTPLNLRVHEIEPNLRRTKIFKVKEPFVVCRSTMTTPIGAAPWTWILPHDFLTELFGTVRVKETASAASAATARQQLEALARDMTTQVTVRLGAVQLTAPQIAALRVGDLVVLNQKTSEPLKAMVSGKPKFLGWPGRIGNRQAFEIASETNRRDRPTTEVTNELATVSGH